MLFYESFNWLYILFHNIEKVTCLQNEIVANGAVKSKKTYEWKIKDYAGDINNFTEQRKHSKLNAFLHKLYKPLKINTLVVPPGIEPRFTV